MEIAYTPIGIIHSPFTEPENMPIQPAGGKDIKATIEVKEEFTEALKDLDGFSHIIVLYHLHKAGKPKLTVIPFMDTEKRGLFATRAPRRPNPIGLSVVKLLRIEKNILHIQNIDMLDGTPVLDIKPYVPEFDRQEDIRTGWLEKVKGKVQKKRSDERFK